MGRMLNYFAQKGGWKLALRNLNSGTNTNFTLDMVLDLALGRGLPSWSYTN